MIKYILIVVSVLVSRHGRSTI